MARIPPNRPSKRRTKANTTNLVSQPSGSTPVRLSRSPRANDETQTSSELESLGSRGSPHSLSSPVSQSPESSPEQSSTPVRVGRSSASLSNPPTLVIPRPLDSQENRRRCLGPLDLSSSISEPRNGEHTTNTNTNIIQQLENFFKNQESFNERLERRVLAQLEQQEGTGKQATKRRLPKELMANVRDVYATLTGRDSETLQWDFSKGFRHPENDVVNAAIMDGIRSTDNNTEANTIKAAMRVHFRTKKRQKKNVEAKRDKEILKQQRKRSRKNTKRLKRLKALQESTSILPEEKEKYEACMKVEFMSSEESASEAGEESDNDEHSSASEAEATHAKILCIKPLPWRSRQLNLMMASLDRKVARKRTRRSAAMVVERRQGPPSERRAPEDAPDFALACRPLS